MEDEYRFSFLDGQTSMVTLELASRQMRYIRIFNVPPETADKDIAVVLGRYGKIRQHIRERYPPSFDFPVYSGVRGVHMEVEKDISANLFIGHFRARIFYEGLKNKCFFCKAEGHLKVECPKLAGLKRGEAGGETLGGGSESLYSSVLKSLKVATNTNTTANPTTLPVNSKLPLRVLPTEKNATDDQQISPWEDEYDDQMDGRPPITPVIVVPIKPKPGDTPNAATSSGSTTNPIVADGAVDGGEYSGTSTTIVDSSTNPVEQSTTDEMSDSSNPSVVPPKTTTKVTQSPDSVPLKPAGGQSDDESDPDGKWKVQGRRSRSKRSKTPLESLQKRGRDRSRSAKEKVKA